MLEVRAVSKRYRATGARREVLREVSLEVASASLVTLCGPSGSGKTTLLNIVATFDQPDAGEVCLCGRSLHRLSAEGIEAVRRRDIGFVFQDFGLIGSLTALENVEMALIADEHSAVRRSTLACAALSSVGIEPLSDCFPHQLSAGQKQRVGMARAIVKRPQIVVADEPTANLDSESALQLVSLMRQLARTVNTAFLVATHDQRLVDAADNRFALSEGRLFEVGS